MGTGTWQILGDFLLFFRIPPMCANHLLVLAKDNAYYPKGRGEQLFLRNGNFHLCFLLASWTLARAKFPEHGHHLKKCWALLCPLQLLPKKWIKPNLLLNRIVKSNSDPLLPRVPNKCHKWYFVETVRYCSCASWVYLWPGLRQPIVMDVIEVCLSDVGTELGSRSCRWGLCVQATRPKLHPQGDRVPFPLLKKQVD